MTTEFPAALATLIAGDADHDRLLAALRSGDLAAAGGPKIVKKEVYYTDRLDLSCPSGWRNVRCVKLTYDDGSESELCNRGSCV
ncbi:MAG: hypothetical protein KGQ52_01340 [Alphaproteobacteria bacterium]|nr:hypothetical protein [Alphaproteobacteria bacterium]